MRYVHAYVCTVLMYVLFTLNTIGEKLTRLTSKQILKKDACVYVQ